MGGCDAPQCNGVRHLRAVQTRIHWTLPVPPHRPRNRQAVVETRFDWA